jgi:hypothetical protein
LQQQVQVLVAEVIATIVMDQIAIVVIIVLMAMAVTAQVVAT